MCHQRVKHPFSTASSFFALEEGQTHCRRAGRQIDQPLKLTTGELYDKGIGHINILMKDHPK